MLCSSCGKDIPVTGQICPYCKADKSIDKKRFTYSLIGAAIGAISSSIIGGIVSRIVGGGSPLFAIAILVGGGLGAFIGQVYGYVVLPSPSKGEIAENDTMPCPYCAETIKKAAKICRFCGYDVTPGAVHVPRNSTTESSSQPTVMPAPAPAPEPLRVRNDR